MSPITILVADKHHIVYAGLQHFLGRLPRYQLIGHVSIKTELFTALAKLNPMLVIADCSPSGFIESSDIQEAIKRTPGISFLIFLTETNKDVINHALQMGVKGIISKESSREEIELAIDTIMKGDNFFCHKTASIIMHLHLSTKSDQRKENQLTVREREILLLLAKGNSTQQIANTLYVSPHTVHAHRKNIIKKLHIKSPTEFVIRAIDLGIIAIR